MIKHVDPQINEQSNQNSPIQVDLRDSVQENEQSDESPKYKPLFSAKKNPKSHQ